MAGLPLMLNGAAGSANLAARPASCPNACMGFPHRRCKTGSSTGAAVPLDDYGYSDYR
nr:hypothetical protein [Mycobacterium tuberculosis]